MRKPHPELVSGSEKEQRNEILKQVQDEDTAEILKQVQDEDTKNNQTKQTNNHLTIKFF